MSISRQMMYNRKYLYKMESSSAVKKNGTMKFTRKWIQLESIVFRDVLWNLQGCTFSLSYANRSFGVFNVCWVGIYRARAGKLDRSLEMERRHQGRRLEKSCREHTRATVEGGTLGADSWSGRWRWREDGEGVWQTGESTTIKDYENDIRKHFSVR